VRPIDVPYQNSANKSWLSQFWAVIAVFLIASVVTFFVWKYESSQNHKVGVAQFSSASAVFKEDLLNTMRAYELFLRSGVGLFQTADDVTRDEWHRYVNDLNLQENFPGIQGVSYNAVLKTREEFDRFAEEVRQNDWPKFDARPEGIRPLYAPVLLLEPLNPSNEYALGFDIISEENRRDAAIRAIETGQPSMTAPIRLVQENKVSGESIEQASVLLILPVFENGVPGTSADARKAAVSGLVVSVFRMGDLIANILEKPRIDGRDKLSISLNDTVGSGVIQLYPSEVDTSLTTSTALFTHSDTFELLGREWTLRTTSAPGFELSVDSNSDNVVLGAGVLVTLLLTSLALGQAMRTQESVAAADELSESQGRIQVLMGEVNHRSKNLLGLVQSIARQTSTSEQEQFLADFSKRLGALSANQDLLVKNKWKKIALGPLAEAQLGYFEGVIGTRILLNGPTIGLTAEAAQTIGMALHELATNAGKYGALSNETGIVDIKWSINKIDKSEPWLHLSWIESGGPPVSKPTKLGFGSKVTGIMAQLSLSAKIDTEYESSGFRWNLECPMSRVVAGENTPEIPA
jgi:two-component sensor histidine kinase/CHASE1-domain containing sensor protein